MTRTTDRLGSRLRRTLLAGTAAGVVAFAAEAGASCHTREQSCGFLGRSCVVIDFTGKCGTRSVGYVGFFLADNPYYGQPDCYWQVYDRYDRLLGPQNHQSGAACSGWHNLPQNAGRAVGDLYETIAGTRYHAHRDVRLCGGGDDCTDGNDCTRDQCLESGECWHQCKRKEPCPGGECNVCEIDGNTGACRCH